MTENINNSSHDPFEIPGAGAAFPQELMKAMLDVWADPLSMSAVRKAQQALEEAELSSTHFLIRTENGMLEARPFSLYIMPRSER